MAITYPLVAPTSTIGAENLTLRLQRAQAISGSPFTYKQQVVDLGGSRWELTANIPPVNRQTAEVWVSFLLSLKGRTGTFLMGDPTAIKAQGLLGDLPSGLASLSLNFTTQSFSVGSVSFMPVIDGSGQTGDTVNVRGLPFNQLELLKGGDYIQIGLGSAATLHKVLIPVSSDADGKASIEIAPQLRSSPADGTVTIVNGAKGLFRLKDSATEWNIDSSTRFGISFDAVEVLI